MMHYFLGIMGFLSLYFFSGYILRLAYSPKIDTNSLELPNAIEHFFGYMIFAFVILFSLVFLKNQEIGLFFMVFLSVFSFFQSIKKGKANLIRKTSFSDNLLIKVSFLMCIILVFFPTMFHSIGKYNLPAIFDMPKHLSAYVAVSHSNTWPIINPWFPSSNFAYNVFFYLPLGSVMRVFAHTQYNLFLYGFNLIWIVCVFLNLIERILAQFIKKQSFISIGLLFSTYFSTLNNFSINVNIPLSYPYQVNEFFTWYIYLPQYLFAGSGMLVSWLLLTEKKIRYKEYCFTMVCASVFLTAYLYLLVVYSWVLYVLFFHKDFKNKKILKKAIPALFLFFLVTLPILIQSMKSGGDVQLLTLPNLSVFKPYLFDLPYLLFTLIGIISLFAKAKLDTHQKKYLMLIFICLVNLAVAFAPDLKQKLSFLLKILCIIPATLGYQLLWTHLRQNYFRFFLAIFFGYFCVLNLFIITSYIIKSYIRMPSDVYHAIRQLNSLKYNDRLLILEPNQNLAAFSQRLVWMDFRPYREDAYLPCFQRNEHNLFFDKKNLKKPYLYDYIVLPKGVFKAKKFLEMRNLDSKDWTLWQNNPKCPFLFNPKHLEIKSNCTIDAAAIRNLKLTKGLYLLSATVSGFVDEGSAHISLFGVKKIINISQGTYNKHYFDSYFLIENPEAESTIAIGFGGWTLGKGTIVFNQIKLLKLS